MLVRDKRTAPREEEINLFGFDIKKNAVWFFSIIFCLVFLSPPVFPGQYDPVLEGISFKKVSDGVEQVSIALNGYYIPKVFVIEGARPQVVCDFFNMRVRAGVKSRIGMKGDLVTGTRWGVHRVPDPKVRVVIDLSPDGDYRVRQVFASKLKAFIIFVERKK